MFKLSIPSLDDFYRDLMADPHVVRVVAFPAAIHRAKPTKNWRAITA